MMWYLAYLLSTFQSDEEHEDRGATMVEYGLIVAVIALVVVVGATAFGVSLRDFFSDLAGRF